MGILTNAGGPGIMCADACEVTGLEVPAAFQVGACPPAQVPSPEASVGNPVDMIASASAEQYRRAIEVLAEWKESMRLIVIFIRPLMTVAEDVAAAVRDAAEKLERRIPLQAVFMSPAERAALAAAAGVPASTPTPRRQ
ncbi:MAG: hypothetical protein U0R26_05865 [Solirubrobacterales bacterium]